VGSQPADRGVLAARLTLEELPGARIHGKVQNRDRLPGDRHRGPGKVNGGTTRFEALGEVGERRAHGSGNICAEIGLDSVASKCSDRDFHVAHRT